MPDFNTISLRFRRGIILAAILGGLALSGVAGAKQWFGGGPAIEGFRQVIPRGRIAAIIDPGFVPASRAKMPDDAWILGFFIDGQAYAYDLNLLNAHEVVNHTVNDKPIAAVW